MPVLTLVRKTGFGDKAPQRFAQHTIVLGTDLGSDLRFDPSWDKGVRPRHCRLQWNGRAWLLLDEGSSEGTWVNGRRLSAPMEIVGTALIELGLGGPRVACQVEPEMAPTTPAGAPFPGSLHSGAALSPKPGKLSTVAGLTLASGIVNLLAALAGLVVLAVVVRVGFWSLALALPIAYLLALGGWEIWAAVGLLGPEPKAGKPARFVAVLEIVSIVFGNLFSLCCGIYALATYADSDVVEYFRGRQARDTAAGKKSSSGIPVWAMATVPAVAVVLCWLVAALSAFATRDVRVAGTAVPANPPVFPVPITPTPVTPTPVTPQPVNPTPVTPAPAPVPNTPSPVTPTPNTPGPVPPPIVPPKMDNPTPGAVLVSTPVGSQGGRVEVPGKISVEIPAGAVSGQETVTVRQGSGGIAGGGTFFVEGKNGAHLTLKQPATVRIPVPAGTNPDEVAVFQEVDEKTAVGIKPKFDAASNTLVFQVTHFSWLSWGKVQKWALYAGGWTVMILIASGGGWTVGSFMLLCSFGAGMGTIEAVKLEHLRQSYGLDMSVRSEHFTTVYATQGQYALKGDAVFLVMENGQWMHTKAKSAAEAKQLHPQAQAICFAHPDVFNLSRELEAVYRYYEASVYNPPQHTWVSAWPNVGNPGEWDTGPPGHPGFLRMDADTIKVAERMERHQTISHEYFHAICDKHGLDGISKSTEESITTMMESEIFPNCTGFLDNRPWKEVLTYLENGLTREDIGPGEKAEDLVKRGYWLWPFAKFLKHRFGGHQAIKDYTSGKLQGEALSNGFERFARSLFDKNGAPADSSPADPLVGTDAQPASFMVPSGWGQYDPASDTICHKIMPLGLSKRGDQFGVLRPLTFALRKIDLTLPRKFEEKEAPVLVVRRKTPWESEKYYFTSNGGATVEGAGSLIVSGAQMLKGGGASLKGRLGIANTSSTPSIDNPLISYLLISPSISPVPPTPDKPQVFPLYQVEPFKSADAAQGINPPWAAGGYRVILRKKPQSGQSEGELIESAVLLPMETKTFDNRTVAGQLEPQSFDIAGICVEDKELTVDGGKALRSGPFMLVAKTGWEGTWRTLYEMEKNPSNITLVSAGGDQIVKQGDAYPWPYSNPSVVTHSHTYKVSGKASGSKLDGTWTRNFHFTYVGTDSEGKETRTDFRENWVGKIHLTLSADGTAFTGTWNVTTHTLDGKESSLGKGKTYKVSGTRVK